MKTETKNNKIITDNDLNLTLHSLWIISFDIETQTGFYIGCKNEKTEFEYLNNKLILREGLMFSEYLDLLNFFYLLDFHPKTKPFINNQKQYNNNNKK